MKKCSIILIICLLSTHANAGIIINELLINEPGTYRNLEWIELYNNSNFNEALDNYNLSVGGTKVVLSDQIILQPYEYIIICRQLFSENDQSAFEKWYGNNSGIWGDTISEQYYRQPLVASFSLINSQGNINLLENNDTVSSYNWTDGGEDGISFELFSDLDSLFMPSVAQSGATPGFVNSITLVDYDLAIDTGWVLKDNNKFYLQVNISNQGLQPVEYSSVYLILNTDTIAFAGIPILGVDEIYTVELFYELSGFYSEAVLRLSADDRHSNNQYLITLPGLDYPPVIISEFLSNPAGTLNSEWIEIKNISNNIVALDNWAIIDAVGNKILLSGNINPQEYLVLVEDKFDFENYYSNNLITFIEPGGWAALNNFSETITLVDNYFIRADYFEYENSFDENYSWSRDEFQPYENIWGRSVNRDGTPGEINELYPVQSSDKNKVTITPIHFSPVNCELVMITIEAINTESYSAGIYDRLGRKIKTFFDKQNYIPSEFNWDGKTDSGRQLPIGVYLFYFEAEGYKPIKTPIVITR